MLRTCGTRAAPERLRAPVYNYPAVARCLRSPPTRIFVVRNRPTAAAVSESMGLAASGRLFRYERFRTADMCDPVVLQCAYRHDNPVDGRFDYIGFRLALTLRGHDQTYVCRRIRLRAPGS